MTQKNKFAKNKQSIKQYRVSENSLNGLGSRQRPSASIGVKAYLKFSLPIVLRVRGSSEAATAIPIREIMVTSELIIIAADQARKCYQIEKKYSNILPNNIFWELLRFFGGSQNFLTNFSKHFDFKEISPRFPGAWE